MSRPPSIDDATAKDMLSLYRRGVPIRGIVDRHRNETGTKYAYGTVRRALIRVGGEGVLHSRGGVPHRMGAPTHPRPMAAEVEPASHADPALVAIYNTLLPVQRAILQGLATNGTTRGIARTEHAKLLRNNPHVNVLRKRFKEPTDTGLVMVARELFDADS